MGDTYETVIEKLVAGGDGLARINGKVVLVPFVIPGEKVNVAVTEEKKEFSRGQVVKIIEASPYRVKPECKYFEKCGGCHWQHMEYAEQLNQKTKVTRDAFTRIGKLELHNPEIISGAPYGYRNRAQFQYDNMGNFGFMERGTNKVVDISHCPVLHKDCRLQLDRYRKSPPDHTALSKNQTEKLHVFAGGDYETNRKSSQTSPKEEIEISILDKTIYFGTNCFFQSNLGMLPDFLTYIKGQVKNGDTLMDLYCGVGLYSVFLEKRFKQLVVVEQSKSAIRYAQKNLSPSKTFFYAGSLENLEREGFTLKPDYVLLNPSRTGLTRLARLFLKRMGSPQLIYVSCNPVTLARDLKDIVEFGYFVQDVKLFDFYPQTAHVETVVQLRTRDRF